MSNLLAQIYIFPQENMRVGIAESGSYVSVSPSDQMLV